MRDRRNQGIPIPPHAAFGDAASSFFYQVHFKSLPPIFWHCSLELTGDVSRFLVLRNQAGREVIQRGDDCAVAAQKGEECQSIGELSAQGPPPLRCGPYQ